MSVVSYSDSAEPIGRADSRPLRIAGLLALVTAIVYLNSLAAPFLFDDVLFIGEDGLIRKAWHWDSWTYLNRAFATWTLQLNYELGGGFFAWQYRLTNVAIHIAAGLTLFGIVRRTFGLIRISTERDRARADWIAAAVAILWLLHPLQTESVTYVVQRYESLMGLFFLLTMYCTIRGAQSKSPRDWYIAAFVACCLGASCKEVMAVCPLVLLLYDRAFLSGAWREAWQRRWQLYLSLLLPVGMLLFATRNFFVGDEASSVGFVMKDISAWEYLCSQPAVILHYLRLAFWPDPLILDYGWPVERSSLAIYGLGAVILLLVGWSLWAMWLYPRWGFLGMTFFLILAPTSSIVPIRDLAFEHRMYLPLVIVVVIVVLAVEQALTWVKLPETVSRHVALALIAITAGGLSLRTMLRNRDYADGVAIWKQCIDNNPSHPRPYRILADTFLKKDPAVAISFYEEALSKNPQIYWLWVDLGNAQRKRKNFAEAVRAYDRATELQPTLIEGHINLSRLRMMSGDYAGAIAAAESALSAQPHDRDSLKQLAWLLSTADDAAVRDGRRALEVLKRVPRDPARIDIQLLEVLSAAHAEAGEYDSAASIAQAALDEARKIHSLRALEFEARLRLYESKRPYRMPVEGFTSTPRPDGRL